MSNTVNKTEESERKWHVLTLQPIKASLKWISQLFQELDTTSTVAHGHSSRTEEAEADYHKLKTTLVYMVSSRLAGDIVWDPVSLNKKKLFIMNLDQCRFNWRGLTAQTIIRGVTLKVPIL